MNILQMSLQTCKTQLYLFMNNCLIYTGLTTDECLNRSDGLDYMNFNYLLLYSDYKG